MRIGVDGVRVEAGRKQTASLVLQGWRKASHTDPGVREQRSLLPPVARDRLAREEEEEEEEEKEMHD